MDANILQAIAVGVSLIVGNKGSSSSGNGIAMALMQKALEEESPAEISRILHELGVRKS